MLVCKLCLIALRIHVASAAFPSPAESSVAMDAKQIRASIQHACKGFIAAQDRNFASYSCLMKFAQRISSESNATHVIEPGWTFDSTVFSYGKAIPYSKAPATLLLPCYNSHCFNVPVRQEWHNEIYDIDQKLCVVLAALGHAPPDNVPTWMV